MPYLNREPLDQLVAEAGMSLGEFARSCDISEVTLSKARHGRAVYPSTLRKLALGLSRIKKLKGFDAAIVSVTKPIDNKRAATVDKTAAAKEASASGQPSHQP